MPAEAEIRALVTELYALVSGPGDQPRDWARQQALFMPDARLIRTVLDGEGRPQAERIAIADYGANFERKLGGRAFYEVEIHAIVEQFGRIAHVFSSYEAFADAACAQFLKRGINSIQLYHEDGRWRITSMVWDDERPGLQMPSRYRGQGPD